MIAFPLGDYFPIACHCNRVTPFCALWYLNFSILTSLMALVVQLSESSVSAILVHVTIGGRVNATGKVM